MHRLHPYECIDQFLVRLQLHESIFCSFINVWINTWYVYKCMHFVHLHMHASIRRTSTNAWLCVNWSAMFVFKYMNQYLYVNFTNLMHGCHSFIKNTFSCFARLQVHTTILYLSLLMHTTINIRNPERLRIRVQQYFM